MNLKNTCVHCFLRESSTCQKKKYKNHEFHELAILIILAIKPSQKNEPKKQLRNEIC